MRKLLFILLFPILSFGQELRQTAEVNMVLSSNVLEDINVLKIDDHSVLMVNAQEEYFGKGKNLAVQRFNDSLNIVWTSFAPLERFYDSAAYVIANDRFLFLSCRRDSKKVELITVFLDNGHWLKQEFEMLTQMEIFGIDYFNGNVIISGEYNFKPVVEMHNLDTKTSKVLPGIYNKDNEIYGMQINHHRNQIYVFTKRVSKCQFQVSQFDGNGKFLSRFILGDKKHKVGDLIIRYGLSGEPLVVGSYNTVCHESILGIFTGSLDAPTKLKYNVISNLKSFDEMYSEKKRSKREQKREEGKLKNIKQKALISVPFASDNGFVVAADIYNSQSPTNMGSISAMSENNKMALYKSYKVHRLLLAEIGLDGRIYYDKMVKMEGNSFYNLFPQSSHIFKDGSFFTLLPNNNQVYYADMSSPQRNMKKFRIDQSLGLTLTSLDFELLSWSPRVVLAFGSANLQVNQQTSNEIYFLKRLEISLEEPAENPNN